MLETSPSELTITDKAGWLRLISQPATTDTFLSIEFKFCTIGAPEPKAPNYYSLDGSAPTTINSFRSSSKQNNADQDIINLASHAILEKVDRLTLHSCVVSKDGYRQISRLRSLRQLTLIPLKYVGVEELHSIFSIENLEVLSIGTSERKISTIEGIGRARRLRSLKVYMNYVELAELSELPRLQQLELKLSHLTQPNFVEMAALKKLTALRMESGNCLVIDEGVERLAPLGLLRELQIIGSGVTDRGAACLARQFRNLVSLVLQNNRIGPEGAKHISSLENLQMLDLTNVNPHGSNHVENEGVAWLSKLSKLHTLLLGSNDITDDGIYHLLRLPQLIELNLSNLPDPLHRALMLSPPHDNHFGDQTALHVTRFSKLRLLDLSYNQLSPCGAYNLIKNNQSETVCLLGCQLPKSLVNMLTRYCSHSTGFSPPIKKSRKRINPTPSEGQAMAL